MSIMSKMSDQYFTKKNQHPRAALMRNSRTIPMTFDLLEETLCTHCGAPLKSGGKRKHTGAGWCTQLTEIDRNKVVTLMMENN